MSGTVGAFCDPELFEELQLTVDGLQSIVTNLIIRLEAAEKRADCLEQLISGGITKSAERATTLNEVVRKKGHVKRGEVVKILECHTMTAQRAMVEATRMFDDLYLVKSDAKKQWVLAVKN